MRVVGLGSAALALALSQLAMRSYGRLCAERTAHTVADYVRLVTRAAKPPARGYDLPQLLIRVRGLDALPLVAEIEVYAATAPLMDATATPIPPAALAALREGAGTVWTDRRVLAPLRAPQDSLVVGAVSVRAAVLAPGWVGGFGVPAFLVLLPVVVWCTRRMGQSGTQALERYVVAALLFGAACYADARFAGYEGARRWLADTRTLVQEAARIAGRPRASDLDGLAGDGTVTRDSASDPQGAVVIHIGAGRTATLRPPRDPWRPWLFGIVVLALLGPLVAQVASRATLERTGT